mgnify:CR=1 FL=1
MGRRTQAGEKTNPNGLTTIPSSLKNRLILDSVEAENRVIMNSANNRIGWGYNCK